MSCTNFRILPAKITRYGGINPPEKNTPQTTIHKNTTISHRKNYHHAETNKGTVISDNPCKFMSHKDGAEYAADHQFTDVELAAIVPDDVARFMKLKAYGNPDADIEIDHPTEGRSSSVEYYKKTISFFSPMRNSTWNPMAGVGNPTRSVAVNELIKAVKKAEVRKQGKPSQARRELKEGEFIQTEEILNRIYDPKKRFMAPAAGKFQFHMVARVDDVAHF